MRGRSAPGILFVAVLTLPLLAAPARASEPARTGLSSTLAIFPDHPLTDQQWQNLIAAIQSERNALSQQPSLAPMPNLQILRGDRLSTGFAVQSSVSLYLHGDCTLPTHPAAFRENALRGALGWVILRSGHIEPFAHVDCALLGQLLVRRSAFLTKEQRPLAMPTAIARVALHEWIHIASQSPAHTRHGITKSQFTVDDLVAPLRITLAESQPSPAQLETAH